EQQADNDFLRDYAQGASPRGWGPLWSRPHGFGGLASIFHYYVDYRSDSAERDLAVTVEDNVSEEQQSHRQSAVLTDPDAAAVEIEPKNEENDRLRSHICPEGEEEEEEEQVFELLNTLTPHKTHQCHLTDGTDIEDDPSCSWPTSSPSSKDHTSPGHVDDYEYGEDEGGAGL
uniref:Uncharacterized protein n=1 Tax=Cyprinus carpio TaxID=7962 RepID=A0A8C2KRJ9_CYPCA